MDIISVLSKELNVKKEQVEAAVKLMDEGNTIPFIARYRKEVTGSLNDEVLRALSERLQYLRNLEERKEQVIGSIREQEKLTPELEKQIRDALTLVAVEDLYRPYKPKRRTRAIIAKEKGLEPLAALIRLQMTNQDLLVDAEKFVSEEKEVASAKEALTMAMDILAEEIAEEAEYRTYIRELTFKQGQIVTSVKEKEKDEKSVYEMYYEFQEPISKLPGHRILAINRGEKEKILSVKVEAPEEQIIGWMMQQVIVRDNPYTSPVLEETIRDSYKRLISGAIEREIRSELTEKAQEEAIKVFGKNLTQLLMQPPIAGKTVLGWDPAFRTGCKLAVVDATGKVLDTVVIFPTAPQNKVKEAKITLKKLIDKYNVSLISLGNGTASRESEMVIVELLKEIKAPVSYIIVNEAGASVYSASKLATEEFPNFDVGQRSAVSIARRIQDPLAELVKIDPKSIGVGQYQHDMNEKRLTEALDGVVEDCVNRVGVDLNTASAALLTHISGISKPIAKNIVAYREANGRFVTRKELLKVAKLGPKAFEQSAGFMRISGEKEPLDGTGIHPESYQAVEKLFELLGVSKKDYFKNPAAVSMPSKKNEIRKMAQQIGIGEITLEDILKELAKPGRDPREDMPKPILRTDVLEMKDLKEGMILKGTVRNVIDFGAFVDIGVHQDGLVHISKITNKKFIKHPLEAVSVGDIVDVKVLSVDLKKNRIQLSMILDA
ncbi:MAG: RNA-binding transcriptional accessory protein [Lachnospiraceae bacterium]|nr:RNA-binding transcriptional accessory protein [Lachnospiraceae bacterium]